MLRELTMTELKLRPGMPIHIVGIGGSGMSAIARVLLGRGFVVSGSDRQANELTRSLATEGATLYVGHAAAQVGDAELVLVSAAVPEDNPELVAARQAGVPIVKRAELLGALMDEAIGIAVAGTHGKTTTTGMISHMLVEAGLDPTVILGGTLPEMGGNGRVGQGPYFVVEADEYDYMFLGLRPEIAIITNVEHDHPDLFATAETYTDAFRAFARRVPADGRLVVCSDDPGVAALLDDGLAASVELTTYGLDESGGRRNHFRAVNHQPNQSGGTDFVVLHDDQTIGLARLRVPGLHNVRNALAAIIVGLDLQIDFAQICRSLASFGGVQRRFEVIGEAGGVTVIDDYAHHPTEIRATLAAARQRYPGRRLWAVWQPHTFSRTRMLSEQFATCFDEADRVIALDVYRSRETDPLGISIDAIVSEMDHPAAVHIGEQAAAVTYILERLHPEDVVVTLSAGDGNIVGQRIIDSLQKQNG